MPVAEAAAGRIIVREKGADHWLDMTTIAIIRIKRPLSLRDAYRDVGGRATQEAKAERVRERGLNQVVTLDPRPLASLSPTLPLRGRE